MKNQKIGVSSNEGDLVVDLLCGSCVVPKCCEKMNRRCMLVMLMVHIFHLWNNGEQKNNEIETKTLKWESQKPYAKNGTHGSEPSEDLFIFFCLLIPPPQES